MAEPSVRDHLEALGAAPEWVISLGEAIQEVTDCPSAIAASRARDLSSHPVLGQGLEAFSRGWLSIQGADLTGLSPMQRETLVLVLERITETIESRMNPGP